MKTIYIVFTILYAFTTSAVYGQCRLNSVKDEFDGSVTKYTDPIKIASDGVGLLAGAYDCSNRIFLSFVSGKGKIVLVLNEKSNFCADCSPSSVTFKFADGTVLTKENVRYSSGQSSDIGAYQQSSYFDITDKELAQFSKSEIARFRIREKNCSDHPMIELDLATNSSKKVRNNAECISLNK